jgi:hypothetical protein
MDSDLRLAMELALESALESALEFGPEIGVFFEADKEISPAVWLERFILKLRFFSITR